MTPADEATFIALWQQGLATAAIAQQLGIPPGTARSRAYALQQAGKIQPRPKGGKRVRQGAVHALVQNSAAQTTMHGAEPVHGSTNLPIPAAIDAELRRL